MLALYSLHCASFAARLGLQGGLAQTLAACRVATLYCSPPVLLATVSKPQGTYRDDGAAEGGQQFEPTHDGDDGEAEQDGVER